MRRPSWSLPHLRVPRLGVVNRVRRSRPLSAPLARARRASSWRPGPRRLAHPALLVGAVALPSILLGRTLARPDWWWDGAQVWAAVAAAVVLTGTGLRWLSHVVRRPHSLTRRGRERILADRHRREQQEEAARHLLTGLRAEREPGELWAEFSASSGLHVPPQVKPLISPAMEPGALVSYLGRGHQPEAAERPLWVVVAVPLLACLLPAAVLVLAV